jgi:hypothetical protein
MPPSSADPQTLQLIRRLALQPDAVWAAPQVVSDLMAHNLTMDDVCDAIVDWIDKNERVKPTVIKNIPSRVGQPAYEMKPKIAGMTWYVKVAVDDPGTAQERMAMLSAHVDH